MVKYPVTLIIMASLLEAKPFINGLSLEKVSEKPFPVFRKNNRVLIVTGIGKACAAAATCYGSLTFAPQTVVNAGAAGSLDGSHPAGGIYQINKIIEHDRPDILTGRPVRHNPDQMDGLAVATLASGDRPVIDPADRKQLAELAELVDMEAAAVVQTCRTMAVPCYVFKFVSDGPGHANGLDIINNIREFRTTFFDFCVINVLSRLRDGK